MKIELLYPEVTGLYGDLFNMEYLRRSVPGCGLASTSFGERPRFLDDKTIDLVYMGSMTERSQLLVLDELAPIRGEIWDAIERRQRFLITGNAIEIFGNRIIENSELKASEIGDEGYECLSLFDFHVERNMLKKENSLFLGKYILTETDAIEVVGFQSRFGRGVYGPSAPEPLFKVERGPGFLPDRSGEGLMYKGFMATYNTGPLLILNPAFLVRLCWEMGYAGVAPAHMDAAMDAYRKGLYQFSNPDTGFED